MAAHGAGIRQRNRRGSRAIYLPWMDKDQSFKLLAGQSCVPMEDLEKYAAGKSLCGWTVKDPQKYDTPSPLAEFGLERPPMSWQYIEIPDAAEVG